MAYTPLPWLPKELTEQGITLRPRRDDDGVFLRDLYIAMRWRELAQTGWPDETKAAFLMQQFDLQTRHYDAHYPGAAWTIIEQDGKPIGRLYLQRSGNDLRLIDIVLLEACRGQGLGTRLIEAVQQEAKELGTVSLSLHVEQGSAALPLYQRLGFAITEDCGVHYRMDWVVPGCNQVKSAS